MLFRSHRPHRPPERRRARYGKGLTEKVRICYSNNRSGAQAGTVFRDSVRKNAKKCAPFSPPMYQISICFLLYALAGVAQPVEQLICNQQVGGSNPSTSSMRETPVNHVFMRVCRRFAFYIFFVVWQGLRWTLLRGYYGFLPLSNLVYSL